jgi:hypothetical protein
MRSANLKYVLLKIGLALLFAGIILPAALCLAQENSTTLPEFYPESFSGQGCIERITARLVVIDDRLWQFSSAATFHTPKMPQAYWSRFRRGYRVGFIKNSENQIESLWYIQKCR